MSTDLIITHVVACCAAILGLGFLFGGIARRLGQPEVIGQILAGIVLGPDVLGHLPDHIATTLIPPLVAPYLNTLSQVALVLFLFAVGYELDLRVLRRYRRVVPAVSLMAFAVPMLLGGSAAFALGSWYVSHGDGTVPRGAFVLFIAVAMSITAVPVLASIVAERGVAGSVPGVVAMTSAGMIDAVGWLALTAALLIAGVSSAGHRPLPITLGLLAGYLLVMVFGVRPALLRYLRRPAALVRNDIPVVVAVAMASAWATAALGLHVIFGAFLAGLIMPRTADGAPDADLVRPLQETGYLLLPLFFVVSGLSVNITGLGLRSVAVLGLVCAIAMAGKLGGGALGARLGGLTGRDSAVVGIMLNTRGLTELIALNIGLQAGVIDQRLYTILVVMALVTTTATGPLLKLMRFPRPEESAAGTGGTPVRGGRPLTRSAPAEIPAQQSTARSPLPAPGRSQRQAAQAGEPVRTAVRRERPGY